MHFDVVIVGGGLAGLALACALRDTRLKLALIEDHPPPPAAAASEWDARVYAISPANADFLRAIGAWKHLDGERIAPIAAMHIVGDAGARLDFSAYQAGIAELGWILEASLMSHELWENVKRQGNVTLLCPARPGAVELGGGGGGDGASARLTLDDGRTLTTRLLVGADGVLACLPLPGQRISIVWSTADAHARQLLALPADELGQRVAAASGEAYGPLAQITAARAFPLRLMRVPRTVAPRLALIGDAAHGIHPLSGHGINLGYQDAKALADLLVATPPWQDIGSAQLLRRYQRARREETALLQYTTHTLHQLFREKLPGFKPLRNIGMALTNSLPIVKNLLVRYAIGAF